MWATPGELKFLDVTVDDPTITALATTTGLNFIQQGTSDSDRIGRKVTVKYLSWKYTLQLVARNDDTVARLSEVVRVIVGLDKQANGALPGGTTLLETNQYQSFLNLSNKDRFRVLMDRTHVLNAQAGAGTATLDDWASVTTAHKFNIKLNVPVEYQTNTGTITDLTSNNFFIMIFSRTGGQASMESRFRLRFTDGK